MDPPIRCPAVDPPTPRSPVHSLPTRRPVVDTSTTPRPTRAPIAIGPTTSHYPPFIKETAEIYGMPTDGLAALAVVAKAHVDSLDKDKTGHGYFVPGFEPPM